MNPRKTALEKSITIGLLLCLSNGDPIEPKLLQGWFKKWQEKEHLSFPALVFHGVRHSATAYKLALSEGDIKEVQRENGHASADMVVNTYAHMQEERGHALTQKVEQDFYRERGADCSDKNEELFAELVEKSFSDESIEKNVLHMVQVNPELQTVYFKALLAQKTAH